MDIQKLADQIRDHGNHPWRRELLFQDKVKWNKMWASMDIIEDTQVAIDFYKTLPEFNSFNGGYLYIYGLLQALYVQQDACSHLSHVITGNKLKWKENYPELSDIREIRNMSIGHPSSRGDKSFHHISRASIKNDCFKLATYYADKNEKSVFKDVSIHSVIEKQNKLVSSILISTKTYMKNELKNHKKKFKGKKLSEELPKNTDYLFSKLYETHKEDNTIVGISFPILFKAFKKIKLGIIARYASLDALTGIKYSIEMLDYIFARLERDLIKNRIDDDKELYIFIGALKNEWKELEDMIRKIDEEFGEM